MKGLYYTRSAEGEFSVNAWSTAYCIFLPDKNVVLYTNGTMMSRHCSLSSEPRTLEEARALLAGTIPNIEGVSFTEIVPIEMDAEKAQQLIQDITQKNNLEKSIDTTLEKIYQSATQPLHAKQFEEMLAKLPPQEQERIRKRNAYLSNELRK